MSTCEDDVLYSRVIGTKAYEGATTRYKKEREQLIDGTSDQIAVNEILLLQLRIAHALRNNGYSRTAANKYVTNLGFLKVNWVDKKTKKPHEAMQELWDEFAENPMLDGYGNLATWQSVSNYSRFSTGSSFTRMHIRRKRNSNVVPLKLENVQTQLHDISYFGNNIDEKIKFGIKFNDTKPSSYFFRLNLYENFPYSSLNNGFKPTEIPADEIIHSFIRTNPGQWIGIPELAAVLIPLYDIDDLVDVTLAKQKIAQAISVVVTGSSPINMLPPGAVPAYINKDRQEVDSPLGSERETVELKSEGTNVIYPRKGENVTFFQGSDIGQNLMGLLKFELRRICNSCDVPYHQVTGDLEGIDFSSLRSLVIELRTRIEFIHNFYTIPLEMYPLTKYFKSLAVLYKKKTINAVPLFQLPRFYGIDELKDAQADQLEMQNGFGLLKKALDERHITYEELTEDLEMRKELREKYGLDLINPKQNNSQNSNKNVKSNSSSL
jgi:capsid protein